jgi:flagellar hook assembly protein FlgD
VAAAALPATYVLEDAFPNPANPETTIRFSIPQDGEVRLLVYNSSGQLVKSLHEGWVQAGTYQSAWDGTDDTGSSLASGVYLYRLESGTFSEAKKLTLLK